MVDKKTFFTIFILLVLIVSNIGLFFVWQESINNTKIVMQNCVNILVDNNLVKPVWVLNNDSNFSLDFNFKSG